MSKLRMDRVSKLARIWSNNELKKFASIFEGDVINVSGWLDDDKEGNKYRSYFSNCKSYSISNYHKGERGKLGIDNEILFDLTDENDIDKYKNKYDVVFNHTTLEHIYEVHKAFKNLCLLSKDIVIIVVPISQSVHYAKKDKSWLDFWRFTPFTIEKMFEENDMKLLYLNCNENIYAGSYIFAIGTKNYEKWVNKHNDFGKIYYDCNCGFKNRFLQIVVNFIEKFK